MRLDTVQVLNPDQRRLLHSAWTCHSDVLDLAALASIFRFMEEIWVVQCTKRQERGGTFLVKHQGKSFCLPQPAFLEDQSLFTFQKAFLTASKRFMASEMASETAHWPQACSTAPILRSAFGRSPFPLRATPMTLSLPLWRACSDSFLCLGFGLRIDEEVFWGWEMDRFCECVVCCDSCACARLG